MEVPRDPEKLQREREILDKFRTVVDDVIAEYSSGQSDGETTIPLFDTKQLIPINNVRFLVKEKAGDDYGYHSIKLFDKDRSVYGVTVFDDNTVLETGLDDTDSDWGNVDAADQLQTKIKVLLEMHD